MTFCGPGVKAAYSTSGERLPEHLRDDQLIIRGVQTSFCMVMGICDISLQNISLTHNVHNVNLS